MGESTALLLTGVPGSGKTTVIKRVVEKLDRPATGFYTREIRDAAGRGPRQGFEMVTLDGKRGILAHVDVAKTHRVSKYGVDLEAIDSIAVPAIRAGVKAGWLVVIDEIGPMEILSPSFRQAVLEALDSPSPLLGAIVRRSTPFTDRIKGRSALTLIEVTRENRQSLPGRIAAQLQES